MKKTDERGRMLILHLLIHGDCILDILGELEKYKFNRFNLKKNLKRTEKVIEHEVKTNLDLMYYRDTDTMLKMCENASILLNELLSMTPEEMKIVNLVLKAVEGNKGNYKIIQNFVKQLADVGKPYETVVQSC